MAERRKTVVDRVKSIPRGMETVERKTPVLLTAAKYSAAVGLIVANPVIGGAALVAYKVGQATGKKQAPAVTPVAA